MGVSEEGHGDRGERNHRGMGEYSSQQDMYYGDNNMMGGNDSGEFQNNATTPSVNSTKPASTTPSTPVVTPKNQ